jgi:DNA modification methylase
MMRHIVATSSRPGDVVLDCFLGSGTTAVAARDLGRQFIGCDMDPTWVEHTRLRLAECDTLPQQLTIDDAAA